MNVTFILKEPNSKASTLIYLTINHDYNKYKFSTKEKVLPVHWNKKRQRVGNKVVDYLEMNARLDKLALRYSEAIRRLVQKDVFIDRTVIQEEYNKILKEENIQPSQKKDRHVFFDFIEKFISDSESGVRLINGQRLSEYTIKGYKVTKNHLLAFQKASNKKLSFDSLDSTFYDGFINYFYEKKIEIKTDPQDPKKRIKKGHTINSVGKHIKNLKVFAVEAKEQGIKVHPDIFKRTFKTLAEETDQVALSVEELTRIEELDLHEKKTYDLVRDCFLLASYTGLRFSDLKQLTILNIIGNEHLKILTQKTGQKVVIPIHPVVRKILTKYNGEPPVPISNQKMNAYIKEISMLAGIDDKITVSKTRAGRKDTLTVPKYELVTVHTARRSFATNLYLAGMDVLTIKKMTGHHTEKSFLKYIRVSEEENAAKAAKHQFFSDHN